MGEFFEGWRRKIGCVVLAIAALLMCSWVRSLETQEQVKLRVGNSSFVLWHGVSVLGFYSSSAHEKQRVLSWGWRRLGFEQASKGPGGPRRPWWRMNSDGVMVSHWVLVCPLTLISACLILWPGKRRRSG